MMTLNWTQVRHLFKPSFLAIAILTALPFLNACSTNPATGQSQFTALMSPQQEVQVGAEEHQKIAKQFGFYEDPEIVNYVREVGRKVTQNTERPDVQYKFFVLDSPIVNAFALPGGYIYVSRGLLALANSEAELAAVLAHETGHITARHSAERYSTGVVTSLGAAVLSAALDAPGASQALGLGTNLYLSSYSRGQENEADTLGLRYMTRGGYDVDMMGSFLTSMQAQTALEKKLEGKGGEAGFNYLSTHPATGERVQKTMNEARQYPEGGAVNHQRYLQVIDGMVYGDSARQGFIRGQGFYHTEIGFGFEVPNGFRLINQPSQVVAASPQTGSVIIFDMVGGQKVSDPYAYLTNIWMNGENLSSAEKVTVNGMAAATGAFRGNVNGRPAIIRLMVIRYGNNFARFQIAIPQNASTRLVEELKRSTYSFRKLSQQEKQSLKPRRIEIITARAGDTVNSLARRQPFAQLQEERFRVLNGMAPNEPLQAGRLYKIIVE